MRSFRYSRSYCDNERDHEDQARSDARRGYPDRDMYDRGSFDACDEAYTRAYDREQRRLEERRYEEEREERRIQERAYERQREADYLEYMQQQEQEYYAQMEELAPEVPDGEV